MCIRDSFKMSPETTPPPPQFAKPSGERWDPRKAGTAKFVINHRRMLNQQLNKANEAFKKAVVDGVKDPDLATKFHYVDHHDIILLDSGEHVWMTEEQVRYNRVLIDKEMTQPTAAEQQLCCCLFPHVTHTKSCSLWWMNTTSCCSTRKATALHTK